uniref:Uncharacterized protein n=1 Tax=Sphaerodactylus townsendi TaxID=933632 RepID=A0ACB8FBA3_9SAUR
MKFPDNDFVGRFCSSGPSSAASWRATALALPAICCCRTCGTRHATVRLSGPAGTVVKYRQRRKLPLLHTIWDSKEMVYCFKECPHNAPRELYLQNCYPLPTKKRHLAQLTSLSLTPFSNWFKN